LESERVIETADEGVRPAADTNCRAGRGADISAGQCTCTYLRGGREHRPAQRYVIGKADLSPEASHGALIVLRRSAAGRHEDAIECARRHNDIACRPRASAVQ